MNEDFVKRMITYKGGAGKVWLESLPNLIENYEEKWSFKAGPPYYLSFNYVAPVKLDDGTEAVLKIGFPYDKEFEESVEAMRILNGDGMVKVLREDKSQNIILLEKVEPGTMLSELHHDEEEVKIAASVMKRIWKVPPADHKLSHLKDWGNAFQRLKEKYNGTSGPLPADLTTRAEKMFETNINSMSEEVILHGDLHHYNILSSHRDGWLAIDPKGIVGEREYEIAAFLHNPFHVMDRPDIEALTKKRIKLFTEELGLSRQKIVSWAFSFCILSSIWSLEDGSNWDDTIKLAYILKKFLEKK